MQQALLASGRLREIEDRIPELESGIELSREEIGTLLLEAKTSDEMFGLRPVQEFYDWAKECFGYGESTTNRYLAVVGTTPKFSNDTKPNVGFDSHPTEPAASSLITNLMSSESVEWYTPPEYVEAAREVMGGIDLDPASCELANMTVQAFTYYSKETDGLKQPWFGRVWLNPPYGKVCGEFVSRLVTDYEDSKITQAVLLVNSNQLDVQWFQPLFNYVLCFVRGRINFINPGGEVQSGSNHGSCFAYFGPNKDEFAKKFAQFGNVVVRYGA